MDVLDEVDVVRKVVWKINILKKVKVDEFFLKNVVVRVVDMQVLQEMEVIEILEKEEEAERMGIAKTTFGIGVT